VLAERCGAWLGDPLAAMTLLASLIDQAKRMLPALVAEVRDHEHSRHDIARALATSPDQARLHYDPESSVADGRWPKGAPSSPSQMGNLVPAVDCPGIRTRRRSRETEAIRNLSAAMCLPRAAASTPEPLGRNGSALRETKDRRDC
jgi:hypothetical protein